MGGRVVSIELVGGPGDGLQAETDLFVVMVPVPFDGFSLIQTDEVKPITPDIVQYAANGHITDEGRLVYGPRL